MIDETLRTTPDSPVHGVPTTDALTVRTGLATARLAGTAGARHRSNNKIDVDGLLTPVHLNSLA
jgi:hypothetical protein